jgi:hypothetical protein
MANPPEGPEPDPTNAGGDPTRPAGSGDPAPMGGESTVPLDETTAMDPTVVGGEPTRVDEPTAVTAATTVRTRPDGPDVDRDRTAAWLLWGLLALLLVGLVAFLLLRDGDDDADDVVTDDTATTEVDDGVEETTPETMPAEDPPAEDPVPPGDAPGTPGAGGTPDDAGDPAPRADDGPGDLRAGNESLFPVPDDLAPFADAEVDGVGVLVDEVVEAVGFWVGDADDNRIFVRVAPGLDTGDFEVEEGMRIDLQGVVRANDPAASEPDEDQGGERYRQQGHHIELRAVRPAA